MTMIEWLKAELIHSERWEDEGGATMGMEVPLVTGRFVRPMPKTTEPPGIPKHWKRTFIIEPIQARMAFGSSKRKAAGSK